VKNRVNVLIRVYAKMLSPEVVFSAQKTLQTVWYPGSAWTCWGAYSSLTNPLAQLSPSVGPREGEENCKIGLKMGFWICQKFKKHKKSKFYVFRIC